MGYSIDETDSYRGKIDELYEAAAQKISRIPNRYLRSYVRGAVMTPFVFSSCVESAGWVVKKVFKGEYSEKSDIISLGNKTILGEYEHHEGPWTMADSFSYLSYVGGLLSMASISLLSVPATCTVIGTATGLDLVNLTEQKIRKYYRVKGQTP